MINQKILESKSREGKILFLEILLTYKREKNS